MARRIRPQPGPQEKAASCPATVIVYGGAAGGGKSWLQAFGAARYHQVKGYSAALFRRTFTMLQGSGSLWDECMAFYPETGASYTTRPLEFTWPAPSRVEFRHLQHEKSAEEHKSKQYARIGFDEATDFTGRQFTFLLSRLRTTCGVPTQFLLTCNPDPDSYLRTWVDWYIGNDGFPDPARDGRIRYFIRHKDEVVWANSREDLLKYVDDPREVMSFCFISAKVQDNKILLAADPTYLAKLKSLPEVEQARFLGGNWDVTESAGDMFQMSWFRIWGETELERQLMDQTGNHSRIVASVRWWDFAATPVKGRLVPGVDRPAEFKARDPDKADDADWTVGTRLDLAANGRIIVSDVRYHQDTPGAIEALVERTAMEDGPGVVCGFWEDPGQAAKGQTERLAARVQQHATVVVEPASKSKLEYAREPSRASYRGNLYYRRAPWNNFFFNQLQQFPSKEKTVHDDSVDSLSGGYHYLTTNCPTWVDHETLMRAQAMMQRAPGDFMHSQAHAEDVRSVFGRLSNRFGAFGRKVL